jgi:hypothetical protein
MYARRGDRLRDKAVIPAAPTLAAIPFCSHPDAESPRKLWLSCKLLLKTPMRFARLLRKIQCLV